MPKKITTPTYRFHRQSGQAIVTLTDCVTRQRRDFLLGEYDSPESRDKYDTIIAQWLKDGRRLTGSSPRQPVQDSRYTVKQISGAYREYAGRYYDSAGHVYNIGAALDILDLIAGNDPAESFGPMRLRECRNEMLRRDHSREHINRLVRLIRAMWKWAASRELVDVVVFDRLRTVEPLRRGKTDAREHERVQPVPEAHIEAVKPHVPRQVAALIDLQYHSAARPGELILLRPRDIDMSGDVWVADLSDHKNAHHGHARTLYFGPKAQAVLRPFITGRRLDAPLFSPAEAEAERRAAEHEQRTTPLHYGNRPGTNRTADPKRQPGDSYTVESYRRAIRRGCEKAGVPAWNPYRLRHTALTRLSRENDIDAAQLIGGHSSRRTTERYVQPDRRKAVELMQRTG